MRQFKVTLQEQILLTTKIIYVHADNKDDAVEKALNMVGRKNHGLKDVKDMDQE